MPREKEKHSSSSKEKQSSDLRSKRRSDDEESPQQQQEIVAEITDPALGTKVKTSRRSDPTSHRDGSSQRLSVQTSYSLTQTTGPTIQTSSRKGNAKDHPSEDMDAITDAPVQHITNQEQAMKVIKDLSPEVLGQFLNSFGAFCNLSEKYINPDTDSAGLTDRSVPPQSSLPATSLGIARDVMADCMSARSREAPTEQQRPGSSDPQNILAATFGKQCPGKVSQKNASVTASRDKRSSQRPRGSRGQSKVNLDTAFASVSDNTSRDRAAASDNTSSGSDDADNTDSSNGHSISETSVSFWMIY